MKVCDRYEHKMALQVLEAKMPIAEIIDIVEVPRLKFGQSSPKYIKSVVSTRFNERGWADRVRVVFSENLTISFMKDRIGICFQLGNVARMYADLLKLESLGRDKKIDVGVIIVPDAVESSKLGKNYVRFDRLVRETTVFSKILDLPILILSLSN